MFKSAYLERVYNDVATKNARQCKERWFNYLSPEIKNKKWSKENVKYILP